MLQAQKLLLKVCQLLPRVVFDMDLSNQMTSPSMLVLQELQQNQQHHLHTMMIT
jgi:hypothetical protein